MVYEAQVLLTVKQLGENLSAHEKEAFNILGSPPFSKEHWREGPLSPQMDWMMTEGVGGMEWTWAWWAESWDNTARELGRELRAKGL